MYMGLLEPREADMAKLRNIRTLKGSPSDLKVCSSTKPYWALWEEHYRLSFPPPYLGNPSRTAQALRREVVRSSQPGDSLAVVPPT